MAPTRCFINSGLTYYEMFWEEPAGNLYFALAHQYAAAELNLLYGSMAPGSVHAALDGAMMLFEAQGDGDTTLNAMERRKAARWITMHRRLQQRRDRSGSLRRVVRAGGDQGRTRRGVSRPRPSFVWSCRGEDCASLLIHAQSRRARTALRA
jgi:hypothetical protein